MNRIARIPRALAALVALLVSTGHVAAMDTNAKQAIIVEFDTGAVLYSKDADSTMYPASMTKMMTAYLLFEQLKIGNLSLNDTIRVSEKAWRKGGSKMFVKLVTAFRLKTYSVASLCNRATMPRSS